jgi:high-affinity Fe2+/Pb2+ permease
MTPLAAAVAALVVFVALAIVWKLVKFVVKLVLFVLAVGLALWAFSTFEHAPQKGDGHQHVGHGGRHARAR